MPLRVLIVDDHEPVRRGIRSLLARRADWPVCGEAADGVEATEMALQLRPNLILMDITMPRMNGAEATRLIRQQLPETRVILVSQNDPQVVQGQAQESGASAWVVKSNLAQDLLPTIEKTLAEWNNSRGNGSSWNGSGGSAPSSFAWLTDGSEMGAVIRSADWSRTPLGPADAWSPTLRTMVKFLLANRFPQLLWWGPEFCSLYNDAYIPILGAKHPWAIGQPVREVWGEIWHVLKPLIETPFHGGPATWMEDIPLEINRRGFVEETHFTIAYSPVPDESAPSGIGGVLATVHEITEKVIGERRVVALRDLGARSVEPKSAEEACAIAAETLARYPKDVPFVLLYLLDTKRKAANLICGAGVDLNDRGCVKTSDVTSTGSDEVWAFSKVLETEEIQVVQDLKSRFQKVPPGPWSEPPTAAVVVPIRSNVSHQLAGFMIAGISSRLEIDKSYRDFLELMSTQIATTLSNARAYEEERNRADALAQIDRAKTEFFSNVSHEFRTPLTLMLGPLEDMLAKAAELSPEQREQLNVAHRNSLRLLKLVNTLLDFSRVEAGRLQASYEPTDLANLTTEVASVFRSAIERAGLRLIARCEPLEAPVYVDREMWEKIVLNLLSNAFKFTFEGEIEVSLRGDGGSAELTVRDTGTGIPADELPHVFERFHRVNGARGRTFEGSGIGLALVQELVRMHGGTVRAHSEIDRGSTFTVTIPFGKAHLSPDRIGASRQMASTSVRSDAFLEEALRWLPGQSVADGVPAASSVADVTHDQHKQPREANQRRRILLADDNADMREYVRRLLSADYDVQAVADGEAALDAVRRQRPDLVLTDVMMPKLDGFGVVRAIRADDVLKDVPVILLSARAGEERHTEGVQAGADDYLTKPFTARDLRARVATHLKMAEVRRESAERETHMREQAELERNRLRLAQAAARVGTWEWDPASGVRALSPEMHRIFGTDASDPNHAEKWHSRVHPDDLQRVLQLIEEGHRSGEIDFEYRYTHPELGLRWLYCKGRTVGERPRMFGVVLDVTDRKRTEEALRQNAQANALLAAIVGSTDDAIVSKNLDGVIMSWNKGAERVFGYTAEEAVGKHITLIIPPDRRQEETEILARLRRGERVDHFETIRQRKDGTLINISVTISPVKDANGRVIGASKVARDVTERKRSEERERKITAEAMAATAKFRAVFEQTTVFAGMMTKDGILVDANKLFLDGCGYRAEDVLGKPFWETGWWQNFPESREKIRKATPQVVRGFSYREMLRYSWSDGTERLVDFALYPILDDKGEVLFLHPSGVDVTDQKRTEENYRKLAETLDAEVRARTEELEQRNAEVLRQSEQLRELSWRLLSIQDEERRHIARELHDSAGQMLAALGMNLSTIVDSVRQSSPENVKVAEQTQELVQQLTREIRTTSYLLHPPLLDENGLAAALSWYIGGLRERSGLDIILNIPSGFGRLPRDMELVVFRLVQECLTNIHRHSGSKVADIRIVRDQDKISVEVRDRGKGIAPHKLADIRGKSAGVGIKGMSERLRQFNGEMTIESTAAGTTVRVNIPIAKETMRAVEGNQTLAPAV